MILSYAYYLLGGISYYLHFVRFDQVALNLNNIITLFRTVSNYDISLTWSVQTRIYI